MLAATMAATGLDQVRADQLLTLLWLPVLPIGTFLLTRRLTGRPWVAVLAAMITSFGGAFVLTAGRLWVNSLFMAGQEAYPLYPARPRLRAPPVCAARVPDCVHNGPDQPTDPFGHCSPGSCSG